MKEMYIFLFIYYIICIHREKISIQPHLVVQWQLSNVVVLIMVRSRLSPDGAAAIAAPCSNRSLCLQPLPVFYLLHHTFCFLAPSTVFNYMSNAALQLHYGLLACGIEAKNSDTPTSSKVRFTHYTQNHTTSVALIHLSCHPMSVTVNQQAQRRWDFIHLNFHLPIH